jgi:DNA-directed RNA polymerase subunit RPC12/RpoP
MSAEYAIVGKYLPPEKEKPMSSIRTFQCPNCGSTVTTTGAEKEVQCAYCGSTVIVPEELRDAPQPQPQPMQYGFGQPSQPSTPVFQNIETVGKVAAGATIGFTAVSFILPIILTCVILGAVGGILYYVFSNVNSTFQQANQISTASAPINLIPSLAPTDTPVPTEAIPTPVPFTKVLFQDDFTDPSSGWSRAKNQDYTLEYKKGNYHILINPSSNGGQAVWIDGSYTNMSVEADAEETSGSNDGTIGVACRAGKKGGMYTFEFAQNGSYSINKLDSGGNSTSLVEGILNPNTVNQNDINHIEGVCDGNTLTMLLNSQVLAQVQDSDFTKGGVGMIVNPGSSGDTSMDVLFSHFLVKGP